MSAVVSRLAAGAALVVLWIAVWRDLSLANLCSGVLVAALALVVTGGNGVERTVRLRPGRAVGYVLRFLRDLVVSSVLVARDAVWPWARISPGVTSLHVPTTSVTGVTMVANRITLTPGTLTLEIRPTAHGWDLDVHVLRLDEPGVAEALADVVTDTLAVLGLDDGEEHR